MSTRIKALIIGSAIVGATGLALATPIVNLTSPFLSQGKQSADIHAKGTAPTAAGGHFRAELETEGASTVSVQLAAYQVGGHNGWHAHPGLVAVTLTQGTIEWFDENCQPTTYTAGDSWVEGSKVHYFKNIGTTNVQLSAFYITAQGQALRTDEAAPACAASLGLI